ncbi:MAG: Ku protein [Bacillota bacterium]
MRSLWTGSLSFGLVNIPIKLYSASEERALSFRLLAKDDLCPVSYQKVCREDDKVVSQKDIVKGYEYEKGEFVVLTPEDFNRAKTAKSDLIDIVAFVKLEEIEAKYYEKPYYLEPAKKAAKAYVLLRDALAESGQVAIAEYAMRDKGHIGMIKPEGDALLLIQLRFADELRKPEDLFLPKTAKYTQKEMNLALSLIKSLAEKKCDLEAFKDEYTEELKKIIEAKAKGKLTTIGTPERGPEPTPVADIMEMLQKSLAEAK